MPAASKKKSEPSEAEKDLEVAVSALATIADSQTDSAHAHHTITSVGKAAQVAQSALDEIGRDE